MRHCNGKHSYIQMSIEGSTLYVCQRCGHTSRTKEDRKSQIENRLGRSLRENKNKEENNE